MKLQPTAQSIPLNHINVTAKRFRCGEQRQHCPVRRAASASKLRFMAHPVLSFPFYKLLRKNAGHGNQAADGIEFTFQSQTRQDDRASLQSRFLRRGPRGKVTRDPAVLMKWKIPQ